MSVIHLLDKSVYDLIAAGEVVDKPNSAIKEAIENSIDAGSTAITVEIKNGGKTYIRITDNGCGMSKEDVPMAFMKHATSKITNIDDLQSVLTLGFRGEALASIAAVSRVELLTKRKEDEFGTHYVIDGSEEPILESTGCPDGTTLIIRDIFYNTPARFKFLKQDAREASIIADSIQKLALSHPNISFRFIKDNKTEIVTSGDGNLLTIIYEILGKEFHDACIKVDGNYDGIKVWGYITKPEKSTARRDNQYYFVNSRCVRCTTCAIAIDEGYRNQLMTNKYPGCVLFIELDPSQIDVNSHPTKAEIKFQDDKALFNAVYFAVKNALIMSTEPVQITAEDIEKYKVPYVEDLSKVPAHPKKKNITSQRVEYVVSKSDDLGSNNDSFLSHIKQYRVPQPEVIEEQETLVGFKHINKKSLEQVAEAPIEENKEEYVLPPIRVVGELFKTYIVCECGTDFLLIDKHAAHERLIFEKIKNNVNDIEMQLLVENFNMRVSYEMHDELLKREADCKRLGFGILVQQAPFISVYGVPATLEDEDVEVLIAKLTDCFMKGKKNAGEEIFDEIYHSIACKAAIKANSDTTQIELEKLVELVTEEDVRYCPHGRPILVKMSKKEIEKMFKRLL